MQENIEMKTVKLAHKSLNKKLWTNGLKLALIEHLQFSTIIRSWANN